MSLPSSGGFHSERLSARQRRYFLLYCSAQPFLDPEEQERSRDRQVVYMARYARGPLTDEGWWDVDLEEFRTRYQDLSEMISEENAASKATEDT